MGLENDAVNGGNWPQSARVRKRAPSLAPSRREKFRRDR
jgi:hypothetical protein